MLASSVVSHRVEVVSTLDLSRQLEVLVILDFQQLEALRGCSKISYITRISTKDLNIFVPCPASYFNNRKIVYACRSG